MRVRFAVVVGLTALAVAAALAPTSFAAPTVQPVMPALQEAPLEIANIAMLPVAGESIDGTRTFQITIKNSGSGRSGALEWSHETNRVTGSNAISTVPPVKRDFYVPSGQSLIMQINANELVDNGCDATRFKAHIDAQATNVSRRFKLATQCSFQYQGHPPVPPANGAGARPYMASLTLVENPRCGQPWRINGTAYNPSTKQTLSQLVVWRDANSFVANGPLHTMSPGQTIATSTLPQYSMFVGYPGTYNMSLWTETNIYTHLGEPNGAHKLTISRSCVTGPGSGMM